jgi:hypothetical protein
MGFLKVSLKNGFMADRNSEEVFDILLIIQYNEGNETESADIKGITVYK